MSSLKQEYRKAWTAHFCLFTIKKTENHFFSLILSTFDLGLLQMLLTINLFQVTSSISPQVRLGFGLVRISSTYFSKFEFSDFFEFDKNMLFRVQAEEYPKSRQPFYRPSSCNQKNKNIGCIGMNK